MAMSKEGAQRQALIDETKRLYIDSTYTGRNNLAAGLRQSQWNTWLGVPATIASALLSSAAAINALVGKGSWLTAGLALAATALTALRAFLRTDKLSEEYSLKGRRFTSLRSDVRMFHEIDLCSNRSLDDLEAELRTLRKRYNDMNEMPPHHIPRGIYKAVKKGIVAGESSYENDPLWKELESWQQP